MIEFLNYVCDTFVRLDYNVPCEAILIGQDRGMISGDSSFRDVFNHICDEYEQRHLSVNDHNLHCILKSILNIAELDESDTVNADTNWFNFMDAIRSYTRKQITFELQTLCLF